MHVMLDADAQNDPDSYPAWCNLSWFHDCANLDMDVERHYHDHAEIWLWHSGRAEGTVGERAVDLYEGVMVYTSAGCQHAYKQIAPHSNTGITPRADRPVRRGHLHVEETGESPTAEMPPFWYAPTDNTPAHPAAFPRQAFLQSACAGRFDANDAVWQGSRNAWWAALVREGELNAAVDGQTESIDAGELLIVRAGADIDLRAAVPSEVAFAIGWPE